MRFKNFEHALLVSTTCDVFETVSKVSKKVA